MKPITPEEALEKRVLTIPPYVIDAFNELIVQNLQGKYSCFSQKQVIALIKSKMNTNVSFDTLWLNVEDMYREAGWKVTYDKSGYNENYESSFTFSIKG